MTRASPALIMMAAVVAITAITTTITTATTSTQMVSEYAEKFYQLKSDLPNPKPTIFYTTFKRFFKWRCMSVCIRANTISAILYCCRHTANVLCVWTCHQYVANVHFTNEIDDMNLEFHLPSRLCRWYWEIVSDALISLLATFKHAKWNVHIIPHFVGNFLSRSYWFSIHLPICVCYSHRFYFNKKRFLVLVLTFVLTLGYSYALELNSTDSHGRLETKIA